jgi:hypothetical protein
MPVAPGPLALQSIDIVLPKLESPLAERGALEETFVSQLDQLRQWYEVVARGAEPSSEAYECLQQFVVAVDVVNDSTAQDNTDRMIEMFDTAVELLKDAASARPRR